MIIDLSCQRTPFLDTENKQKYVHWGELGRLIRNLRSNKRARREPAIETSFFFFNVSATVHKIF